MKIRLLLVLLAVGLSLPAQAQLIFRDGFESGDGSGWDYAKPETSSYTQDSPRTGSWAGRQSHGAQCDIGAMFETYLNHSGSIYARAAFRFPVGFSFTNNTAACSQSTDHKAMIFETSDVPDRCILSFASGSGSSSNIILGCGGASNNSDTGADIVADGQWHMIEIQLNRTTGGGSYSFWMDGVQYKDAQSYQICTSTCAALESWKLGAYVNYAYVTDQTWDLDDALLSHGRMDVPPPPIYVGAD